jgi:hypothetical protein
VYIHRILGKWLFFSKYIKPDIKNEPQLEVRSQNVLQIWISGVIASAMFFVLCDHWMLRLSS